MGANLSGMVDNIVLMGAAIVGIPAVLGYLYGGFTYALIGGAVGVGGLFLMDKI